MSTIEIGGSPLTVTHNCKQYTVKRCALNDNQWRLTSVDKPREQITLNRWQMHIAGFGHLTEMKA
ncbi:hypothetical protein [Pseudescherichia sp.]|uniref:hypothetical protein n=1 Tax=Pseudescherichia sp. TaxID=2055881 RepID=UPI00289D9BCE|nr:hypothetical protein [Pseudescherichia sp.]